jgi:alkylhydroperoxidase/carboxymuconolactone decarboxylase family protein YurZ
VSAEDPYAHLTEAGRRGRELVTGAPATGPDPPTGGVYDLGEKLVFGDVWQRPGLSVRDRRLVTIAVLGMVGDERPLGIHIRGALRSGDLSREELEAFAVQFAFYAGFPRATLIVNLLERELAALAEEAAG